jgi:hypothetical protein
MNRATDIQWASGVDTFKKMPTSQLKKITFVPIH